MLHRAANDTTHEMKNYGERKKNNYQVYYQVQPVDLEVW